MSRPSMVSKTQGAVGRPPRGQAHPRLNLPSWAQNGGVAYCRWDGGPMEVAKAALSGWDYMTSPHAVCAMYEWYGDRGFQLVREGGFNWIWVTWSCGFSYESESVQHRFLRPFIARCRKAGIHVTAYMSMCNVFHHDVAAKQPGLLECLQVDGDGQVVPYAAAKFVGKPERVLACLNHPKWRAHLKNRLKSAIEAGAEAAFYDNLGPWCMCPRCRADFRRFTKSRIGRAIEMPSQRAVVSPVFAEVAAEVRGDPLQWQLSQAYQADLLSRVGVELTRYAESFVPSFLVYLNWHAYHQTFGSPSLKALSTEDGVKCGWVGRRTRFSPHRLFHCGGYRTNTGLLRRMLATADGVRPLRIQSHQVSDGVYMESRHFEPYAGSDWQRMLAESWCFRAAQEVFLEGNFQTRLFAGDPAAARAWRAIGAYQRFQRRHARLWTGATRSEAAFAVLVLDNDPHPRADWQRLRFLSTLAMAGYQFDVVLDHQLDPERLAQYPLLWCPSVERLRERELAAIEGFLRVGGTVVCTGPFARFVEIGKPRAAGSRKAWLARLASAGGVRFQREAGDDDEQIGEKGACAGHVPRAVRSAQQRLPIRVEAAGGPVVWTAWRHPGGKRVVFVLNPDDRAPRRALRIEVRGARAASWHTPDPGSIARVAAEEARISIRVSRLDVFGFAAIEPSSRR